MKAVWTIARAVMADAIRRKVVWVVLIFGALLAFVIPSLPSYGQGVVGAVYREVAIALMFATALVLSLALSATRIPAEVERRTVFNVLARDVRRWQYVVGTWVGVSLVTGGVVLAFTVIAVVTGMAVYGDAMLVLFEGALAVWLEMGVIMAMAVLVTSRYSPVTAIVAALTFLFVGHSISGLVSPDAPAAWWVPSLDAFNVVNPVAHGSGFGAVYALSMLAVFSAWSGLLLLGASVLFARRDL